MQSILFSEDLLLGHLDSRRAQLPHRGIVEPHEVEQYLASYLSFSSLYATEG